MTVSGPTSSGGSLRASGSTFDDSGKPPLVRSPLYVLRAVFGLVLTCTGIGLLLVFENALLGLRTDVATAQASWPDWIADTVGVTLAIALLITIVGTNVYLLAHRKFRRWVVINLAAIVAVALVVLAGEMVLALASSPSLERAIGDDGSPGTRLGNEALASLIAVVTVSGPWITRRLRPWAAGLLTAATALSFLGGASALVTLPLDIGVGILAGAAVALLVGTPDRTPRSADVAVALADCGIPATEVRPAEMDAGGAVPWLVSTADGSELFVKTLGTDQRAADLLFRLYRFLRLRRTGDRHPSASLRRAVEHEALLSLAAGSRNVRTPQLVTIADIGTDGMLLAYRRVPGRALESMDPAEVTLPLLAATWEEVSRLHREGIAHRDLQPANVLVGDDGLPWLVDFGFAELAADPSLQARDVAELLAATAAIVGTEGAVAVAVDTLGPDPVAAALPWVQPLALTSATRTRIGRAASFRQLRTAVAQAVGIDEVRYERIERVTPRTLLILASIGLAAYALLPQLAAATGFLDEVGRADLVWVGVAVVASLLTYIGAAVGMVGAVPSRIGLRPMIAAQLASSFSNRVTPAKVGGMATNVRFLQKRGIPATTAVSAVGLNTLAGFVVHAVVLVGAVALAGTSTGVDLPLPTATTLAIIAGAVALVAAVAAAVPSGRRALTRNLWPALRAAVSSIATIARTPTKLAALFAGSALVTAGYTLAMLASLSAFGAEIPVAGATAVYLAASAVGDAAPTPGGVGAIEAALIAGYTAVGVDPATAFAAVLLFRLVTFWLPILPGWWALVSLQSRSEL